LRRELKLRCRQKRKFKATTNSNHNLPVAENLLNQTFTPSAPNEVWVTDITYIPTGEGWLYLAGVKDVFTCEIVGYAMAERMTQDLTGRALFRAAQQKRPVAGLIHHSDRGSQYCSHDYRKLLEQFGMKASMSRRGNCYDNAPMESFWGSLKNELVHHCRYAPVQRLRPPFVSTSRSSTTANDAIRASAILRRPCSHKVSASRRLPLEMRVSTIDRTPQDSTVGSSEGNNQRYDSKSAWFLISWLLTLLSLEKSGRVHQIWFLICVTKDTVMTAKR